MANPKGTDRAGFVYFGAAALLGVVMATVTIVDDGVQTRMGWIILSFAAANAFNIYLLVRRRRSAK